MSLIECDGVDQQVAFFDGSIQVSPMLPINLRCRTRADTAEVPVRASRLTVQPRFVRCRAQAIPIWPAPMIVARPATGHT